jgi:hypothetical protein
MSLLHQMFLQTLRDLDTQDLAHQRAYQARLLRRVLDHAATTVAADHDRLALARLSPDPLAVWARIPILDLSAWSAATHTAKTLPADAQDIVHGRSRLACVAADAVFERGLERTSVYLSSPLLDGTDRVTALNAPTQWNSTISGAHRYLLGTALDRKHHLHLTQAQLKSYPDKTEDVERVLVNAFYLDADVRAQAQAQFNTSPVCVWSCDAFGILGMEIQTGHIRHEVATHVIEIVDTSHRPCPIGQPGDVVVTSLYDYATPMIRLRLPVRAKAIDPWTLSPAT